MAHRVRHLVPDDQEDSRANTSTELISGGIGRNLPQEAPQAFADAILSVARA